MAEVIFILTVAFAAYVIYYVVDCEQKNKKKSAAPKQQAAAKSSSPKPRPRAGSATTAASAAAKPATTAAASSASGASSDTLKNPKTGEESKISSNYRFTKRWIKEALVEEGLLEKIYKNSELDDEITEKINTAVNKLKTMTKYHP